MAKRYRKKSTRGKKSYRKRGYRKRKLVVPRTIVSLGQGFPKLLMCTHKYSELQNITSTLGVPTQKSWCLNGMFDPNVTGFGHQPLYYDNLQALYNHFTILGSKMTIKVMAYNVSQPAAYFTIAYNDDSTLTATALDSQNEQARSKLIMIPQGSGSVFTRTFTYSAKRTFGKGVLNNPNLEGSLTANPTESSNVILDLQAIDGASTVSISCNVQIEYLAVWKELKDAGYS